MIFKNKICWNVLFGNFKMVMFHFLHKTSFFQISPVLAHRLSNPKHCVMFTWWKIISCFPCFFPAAISIMLVCQEKPSHTNPFTLSGQTGPENSRALTYPTPQPKTQVPPLFHLRGTEGQQCNGGLNINNIFHVFTKPESLNILLCCGLKARSMER